MRKLKRRGKSLRHLKANRFHCVKANRTDQLFLTSVERKKNTEEKRRKRRNRLIIRTKSSSISKFESKSDRASMYNWNKINPSSKDKKIQDNFSLYSQIQKKIFEIVKKPKMKKIKKENLAKKVKKELERKEHKFGYFQGEKINRIKFPGRHHRVKTYNPVQSTSSLENNSASTHRPASCSKKKIPGMIKTEHSIYFIEKGFKDRNKRLTQSNLDNLIQSHSSVRVLPQRKRQSMYFSKFISPLQRRTNKGRKFMKRRPGERVIKVVLLENSLFNSPKNPRKAIKEESTYVFESSQSKEEESMTDFTKLLTSFSRVFRLTVNIAHNLQIAYCLVNKNKKSLQTLINYVFKKMLGGPYQIKKYLNLIDRRKLRKRVNELKIKKITRQKESYIKANPKKINKKFIVENELNGFQDLNSFSSGISSSEKNESRRKSNLRKKILGLSINPNDLTPAYFLTIIYFQSQKNPEFKFFHMMISGILQESVLSDPSSIEKKILSLRIKLIPSYIYVKELKFFNEILTDYIAYVREVKVEKDLKVMKKILENISKKSEIEAGKVKRKKDELMRKREELNRRKKRWGELEYLVKNGDDMKSITKRVKNFELLGEYELKFKNGVKEDNLRQRSGVLRIKKEIWKKVNRKKKRFVHVNSGFCYDDEPE